MDTLAREARLERTALKWNSRKLGVALVGLATATALVWFGRIDAVAWSTAFVISVGGYMGAQAWEDVKRGQVSGNSSSSAFRGSPVHVTPVA